MTNGMNDLKDALRLSAAASQAYDQMRGGNPYSGRWRPPRNVKTPPATNRPGVGPGVNYRGDCTVEMIGAGAFMVTMRSSPRYRIKVRAQNTQEAALRVDEVWMADNLIEIESSPG